MRQGPIWLIGYRALHQAEEATQDEAGSDATSSSCLPGFVVDSLQSWPAHVLHLPFRLVMEADKCYTKLSRISMAGFPKGVCRLNVRDSQLEPACHADFRSFEPQGRWEVASQPEAGRNASDGFH